MKPYWIAVFALLGCNGNNGDSNSEGPQYSQQSPNGVNRPSESPTETWSGNLATGEVIDLDFAQEIYCFPANENENFSGNHMMYDYTQPTGTNITVIATPVSQVDVSLYVIQTGVDTTFWPPNTAGGGGTICEAEYDQSTDNNPGKPEGTFIGGWDQPYRLIIGVAGAGDTYEGEFKVEIWESTL